MNRKDLPDHAKYGPSSMARIMACPASVELSLKAPPEKESPYAADGTKAHARAEELFYEGHSSITCEDEWAVDIYAEHIDGLATQCEKAWPDDVDEPWGVESLSVFNEELFGTIDFWALVGTTLHVRDYKHGAGIKVFPEDNKQMLTYAGLLMEDQLAGYEITEVVLGIVQPRAHGGQAIETWSTTPGRVHQHMTSVHAAIELAKSDNPHIEMGEHCRFCRAKLICPAMEKAQQGVSEWDSRDLDPDQLAKLLIEAEALEQRINALFNYAHQRAEVGERIPGWKLVAKRASKRWRDEAQVIERARRWGLLKKLRPTKLVSPAQAAKILTPEQYALLDVDSVSSGTTLKPESNPAPAVDTPMAGLAALGKLNR